MKSTYLKKQTEKQAQAAMVGMLEGKLVRAEKIGSFGVLWGVVVPIDEVNLCTENTIGADQVVFIEKRVFAIWKNSREKAVKAYETAGEHELRVQPLGLLTDLNVREWEFELVEESW